MDLVRYAAVGIAISWPTVQIVRLGRLLKRHFVARGYDLRLRPALANCSARDSGARRNGPPQRALAATTEQRDSGGTYDIQQEAWARIVQRISANNRTGLPQMKGSGRRQAADGHLGLWQDGGGAPSAMTDKYHRQRHSETEPKFDIGFVGRARLAINPEHLIDEDVSLRPGQGGGQGHRAKGLFQEARED